MSELRTRWNPPFGFEAELIEDHGPMAMAINWYDDPHAHGGDLLLRVFPDGFHAARVWLTNEQMDVLARDWLEFRGHREPT